MIFEEVMLEDHTRGQSGVSSGYVKGTKHVAGENALDETIQDVHASLVTDQNCFVFLVVCIESGFLRLICAVEPSPPHYELQNFGEQGRLSQQAPDVRRSLQELSHGLHPVGYATVINRQQPALH